ncbi:hypothetical protein [Streptomyces sp. 184]|uniref:hypothetical protein n=1 Tax=Streptomyces sp. 184 TaxID=1827526 RepID=UPI003892A198
MEYDVFVEDLGPEFTGWSGMVNGKMVCIVPPTAFEQHAVQHSVRALVRRQGVSVVSDCTCSAAQGGTIEAVA